MYTRSLYIYRFFYVFHILKINHIFAKIMLFFVLLPLEVTKRV